MMDSKIKYLNLMHVNIKGLGLNLEELLFSLNKKKIDIASIKQTFSEKKRKTMQFQDTQ